MEYILLARVDNIVQQECFIQGLISQDNQCLMVEYMYVSKAHTVGIVVQTDKGMLYEYVQRTVQYDAMLEYYKRSHNVEKRIY